ncbi:MAG: CehA/McbA family metallohydrolase [Candidatus Hydrogenedentes bacterium]|nr:CehA/McbA family metallohydrolase [Candidatus Hydrogenedentota bacterium]
MANAVPHAPRGACVCWGVPFHVSRPIHARDNPVRVALDPFKARWLVFMHTSDVEPLDWNAHGFISPMRGNGRLGEHVATYVLRYADGSEARHAIRRRRQIGMVQRMSWGENCTECVVHRKPCSIPLVSEQAYDAPRGDRGSFYGVSTTRVQQPDFPLWANYLWAWENPHPEKEVVGLTVEPCGFNVILSGISAGVVSSNPLRWEARKKCVLRLPKGVTFDPKMDAHGLYGQVQIDLGQVISAQPRFIYPNDSWAKSYDNQVPAISERDVLVEYTAHPDAHFHVLGKTVPVQAAAAGRVPTLLTPIVPATKRVTLRVVERASKRPVPVKLHVHGEAGEYLAPIDRHRNPNTGWIEDYSADFVNQNLHRCAYISGETAIDLPLGRVYVEVSKGFEIAPVRMVFTVAPSTNTITLAIDKVLDWRERGWVTADTHVHFLSPTTALLEGEAEGVNVVNLLASQWGELMTNVGDFDGRMTWGSREAGGDGEYLVRVGTENRQHVLGHISLLGYTGNMIVPLCVGGPDESALGDPVSVLMSEWARQCKKQGGLVIMPHFPNPRLENAANLISGEIDAVEMTSWGNLYGGIDPYSLSDWYRYLNCGYFIPAVGGTDKMTALTPVGAIRTYARIPRNRGFTYANWMEAIRAGNTFVTYGPLIEFSVEGKPAGARIKMKRNGGAVDVEWNAASVTAPMSRVDLVVNGEIRESKAVNPRQARGAWRVKVDRCSWIALLVRGHYPDKPEIVAAHTSPVMVEVAGTEFFSAVDAETMLDQIEGALAYLDTIGTRVETATYKRMRMILTAAHRKLHNEMHRRGHGHHHTHAHDHHNK